MRVSPFIAVLALLLAATSAQAAAPELRFQTLTIDDGLAQNSVTAIAQDANGYLWFGSQDGLNRYDGLRFAVFKNDPNDAHSIPANYITTLLAGDDGDVWVGTRYGGLARFDAASGRFERVPLAYETGVTDSRFIVHALGIRDGLLWAALDRGLAFFDTETRVLRLEAQAGAQPFAEARALYVDDAGLWIGGVNRVLARTDGAYRTFRLPEANLVVHALDADANGVIHAATNRGVFRRVDGAFERVEALPPALFTTIAHDDEGGLWVGGRGTSVYYRADVNGAWRHFAYRAEDDAGIGQNIIFDIHADRDGVVWIGTYGGGLSRTLLAQKRFGLQQWRAGDANGLSSNVIFPIHEDADGIVWLGMYNDGNDTWTHYRHDPRDPGSLAHDEVRSLLSDAEGRTWVGTHGGLDRLDPGASDFVHYRHDPKDATSLANDQVTALFIDSRERFWVGTWGGGLDRFDPATGVFTHHPPDASNPDALGETPAEDRLHCRALFVRQVEPLADFLEALLDFGNLRFRQVALLGGRR